MAPSRPATVGAAHNSEPAGRAGTNGWSDSFERLALRPQAADGIINETLIHLPDHADPDARGRDPHRSWRRRASPAKSPVDALERWMPTASHMARQPGPATGRETCGGWGVPRVCPESRGLGARLTRRAQSPIPQCRFGRNQILRRAHRGRADKAGSGIGPPRRDPGRISARRKVPWEVTARRRTCSPRAP